MIPAGKHCGIPIGEECNYQQTAYSLERVMSQVFGPSTSCSEVKYDLTTTLQNNDEISLSNSLDFEKFSQDLFSQ